MNLRPRLTRSNAAALDCRLSVLRPLSACDVLLPQAVVGGLFFELTTREPQLKKQGHEG